ncbi:MAG: hypothetical protein RLZZ387_5758 [Chloroflexota bacterium]|jgi:hypothetical protein
MHTEGAATGRLRILAATEYIALVEQMREGRYDGDEECRALSSQHSPVHDELIALMGLEARTTMYGYCRNLLRETPPAEPV